MSEVTGFTMADGATYWFRKELERIRDFMAGTAGRSGDKTSNLYLQDGGEPVGRILASLTPEECNRFQKEFLE